MKYLIIFMLISFSAIGQIEQKGTIAGNDITFTYNTETKSLEGCILTKNDKTCKTYTLPTESIMTLGEDLQTAITTFFNNTDIKYDFFGTKLHRSSISTNNFTPVIDIDIKELETTSNAVIKINNALEQHYFMINRQNDTFFVDLNDLKLNSIQKVTFTPSKKPEVDESIFKQDLNLFIANILNTKKSAIQIELLKKEKTFTGNSVKAIYNATVINNKEYSFETKEDFKKDKAASEKTLSIYSLFETTNFKLKITDLDNITESKTYGSYPITISKSDFVTKIIEQHDEIGDIDDNKKKLRKVYKILKKKIDAQIDSNQAIARSQDEASNFLDYKTKVFLETQIEFAASAEDMRSDAQAGYGTLGLKFERGLLYGGVRFTVFSRNDSIEAATNTDNKIFGTNLLIPENSSNGISNFSFTLGTKSFYTLGQINPQRQLLSWDRIGANLKFSIHNTIWELEDTSLPITITSFDIAIAYRLLTLKFEEEGNGEAVLSLGLGYTNRRLGGDYGLDANEALRTDFIGTDDLGFDGVNLSARLEVANFFGQVNLTSFGDKGIAGFSGYQAVVNVGFNAQLNLKAKEHPTAL